MIHPIQQLNIQALNAAVTFPLGGRANIASINAIVRGATWGTAILTPRWSNLESGPFFDFATNELADSPLGPGDDSCAWANVQGKGYMAIFVSTAEGGAITSPIYVDVVISDDQ